MSNSKTLQDWHKEDRELWGVPDDYGEAHALIRSAGSQCREIRDTAAEFFWKSRQPISQIRKDNFWEGFITQRAYAKALGDFLTANVEM